MAADTTTSAPPVLRDERDASLSPMSRSPLSTTPSSRPGTESQSLLSRFVSPLRQEHKANGSATPKSRANGSHLGSSTSPSEQSSSTPLTSLQSSAEFPFAAPPGTSGQQPTNDLIEQEEPVENLENIPTQDSTMLSAEPSTLANGDVSNNEVPENGTVTPPGRRSVQFASRHAASSLPSHSRHQSVDAEEDTQVKERDPPRLFSKLRALASPSALKGHGRSMSGWTIGSESQVDGKPPTAPLSLSSERSGLPLSAEDEGDADAEESAGEGPSNEQSTRRRRFRRQPNDAPTTPKENTRKRLGISDLIQPSSAGPGRPAFVLRAATMNDIPENQRLGVSEDEGRNRLAGSNVWRRGSAWVGGRGTNYSAAETPTEPKRPRGLRRLTGFGSELEASPSPWRRGERTSSASAQKWRQLKAGLKLLSSKRKEERIKHAKSAELIAELLAGSPAAIILASMFQRDEAGHRRVPVLLEQLQLRVTDSHRLEDRGDKHLVFRIELEYGSSLTKVKWVLNRTLGDILKMHSRFRLQSATGKYIQFRRDHERSKQPKFPKSTFPAAEGFLKEVDVEDDDEPTAGELSGHDTEAQNTPRPGAVKRRRSSFTLKRKRPAFPPGGSTDGQLRPGSVSGPSGPNRGENFAERQRRKLEEYLNKMITWVMFRPESNRLCRFLELSALGVLLAPEGGYHGKEGFMAIHSMTGLDVRKGIRPSPFRRRLPSKWFLVRQSYLVAVDSPEALNVFDVFLVDPDFEVAQKSEKRKRDETAQALVKRAKESATYHNKIKISNSERTIKLGAHDDRRLTQFVDSINFMKSNSVWAKPHRYHSFAPVRHNVHAQVLIDGRDYMWNVSRAISMARDVIYIHDWWLSPEIYLRRPAAISQKWRLDRLLKQKADEGVKIYVIMYRNVNSAIPIDSEYSKFSLLNLSDNVFVQRSPNQLRQSTFFWSHHEKILVVDHCVAFCGGVDLCFGRWDTPGHPLVDDKLTGFEVNDMPKDADHCQLWPGKDYSNPRVQDFYSLDQPYEEMYDRTKVPRMPWHDVGMQMVGEPARDLSRHFIQRWNYVLRQRNPSRPTPMLLPPPDFLPADIEALHLQGTCEVQLLRSAGEWSLGINKTEHSIMTAYTDTIRESDHFVYMENQFFITSCEYHGVRMENTIGDALVERIIRAAENDEDWRAVIVIPLMPGYQNSVDSGDGTSIRLIMLCQFASICRGESSIFGRLRAREIDPEDYIHFYSLRQWDSIGPTNALVTEQLYIHAKIMIVDDRVAIIGSANINERSLLGNRDSEVAAIIRDTDMIQSYMGGREYPVAKFAHNMRVRLMREHLGLDVDRIREEEEQQRSVYDGDTDSIASELVDGRAEQTLMDNKHQLQEELIRKQALHTFNNDVDWAETDNPNMKSNKKPTSDPRIMGNLAHEKDVLGEGADHMIEHNMVLHDGDGRDTVINANGLEALASDAIPEHLHPNWKSIEKRRLQVPQVDEVDNAAELMPPPPVRRMNTYALGLPQLSTLPHLPATDDTDIGGPPLQRTLPFDDEHIHAGLNTLIKEMRLPVITDSCMIDPLSDSFHLDIWHTVAENNTKLYRQVFRCQPDNEVKTWAEYKEYETFQDCFNKSQGVDKSKQMMHEDVKSKSGPPGSNAATNQAQAIVKNLASQLSGGDAIGEKLSKKISESADGKPKDLEKADEMVDHPILQVEDSSEKPADGDAIKPVNQAAKEAIDEKATLKANDASGKTSSVAESTPPRRRAVTISEPVKPISSQATERSKSTDGTPADDTAVPSRRGTTRDRSATVASTTTAGSTRRRRRKMSTKNAVFHHDDENVMLSKEDAEKVLETVQGALVLFPYNWLEDADWGFAVDMMAPLEIYD